MGRRRWQTLGTALGLWSLVACAGPASPEADLPVTPFAVVLGTAQDGGLPQIGCRGERCSRARAEPSFRRLVSSLLVVDPRSGKRWLFDATPDIAEQVELAERFAPRPEVPGRPALFDGVFLTHAHLGHYTGLSQLGREAYGSAPTAVHGSARMVEFLSTNGPWDLLVQAGHVELRTLRPGESVALAPDLSVDCFTVPHRDEYTDTLAFVVTGPTRRLLFLPDVDKWTRLEPPIEERLAAVDVALVDGTFFAEGEIPGRAMAEIPHPFITESLERFAGLSSEERAKVVFTHLNHTNPAVDPEGSAAAAIRSAGSWVAREGDMFQL